NHPTYELGSLCIGCAWHHDLPASGVDAVEIATGGWDKVGQGFDEGAIAFWDGLCAQGHHIAAIGGSDDHRGGKDLDALSSPIGNPATLVYASELSVQGILAGIRNGRTVVKLQDNTDPMVELDSRVPPVAATVKAARTTFRATVSGGLDKSVRF